VLFFFSSRRRHTRSKRDWSSDVCSSDLGGNIIIPMFVGAFLNTFFPKVLEIGGFTTPLAQGSGALVGAFLFIIGGTISFKSSAEIGRASCRERVEMGGQGGDGETREARV